MHFVVPVRVCCSMGVWGLVSFVLTVSFVHTRLCCSPHAHCVCTVNVLRDEWGLESQC